MPLDTFTIGKLSQNIDDLRRTLNSLNNKSMSEISQFNKSFPKLLEILTVISEQLQTTNIKNDEIINLLNEIKKLLIKFLVISEIEQAKKETSTTLSLVI